MNHLKNFQIFESEEGFDDILFKEVDKEEYFTKIGFHHREIRTINITDSEILKIEKMLLKFKHQFATKNDEDNLITNKVVTIRGFIDLSILIDNSLHHKPNEIIEMNIKSLKDDYYTIHCEYLTLSSNPNGDPDKYFICDTFKGLKNCLKELLSRLK
jgi:hypothetical protein